ncbi:aminotransferase class I/II-fold pyridoxal phosphate-dependent enzyme [Muricauda sp. CAU 1633]|uniref:aminotransferase class I/II-fold pyridoxal phosphate-dependent enzyme n=1 Tax=Allomuricauda sp. CAU 1633 TaxID=2816036 RepID=UPI001A8F9F8C|nr:aminotransferase class I/II-fold pyridoxal phosphate-dependent enzyme [Muricauda sp. CAU 1633]MBO0321258.1 aminotransferase class I/II-fold pyridoxal phosphate-dependent enzyme [Muricauda sp. CAU 1633]
MEKFPKKLLRKLSERMAKDAMRNLLSVDGLVDFSSNDYLGFARNENLSKQASIFLEKDSQKNGATGSRLLTGNHDLYVELEDFLTMHHKSESALVFNSGYDANVGFFSSVPQRGDIIFYDELVHASIRDGIQMGHAKNYKFEHNSIDDLRRHIERSRNRDGKSEIYIATESVFSMDGDSPDLVGLANFCTENGCHLIVDEAHATGIFGEGRDLTCQLGLEKQVFARIITFGKALGCHGAAILGSDTLKSYLVNFARSLIYTTALPPHSVAILLGSYHYLRDFGEEQCKLLQQHINYFKIKLEQLGIADIFIESNSAIQCAIIPGNATVKPIASKLQQEGFDVRPILSPTVKEGEERLRFCLHAFNTTKEISQVLKLLKSEFK